MADEAGEGVEAPAGAEPTTADGAGEPAEQTTPSGRWRGASDRGVRPLNPRGTAWEIRVTFGRDPLTGRAMQASETFHGGKRAALERRAAMLLELKSSGPTRGATVGDLLEAWLARCERRHKDGELAENTLKNYQLRVRQLRSLAPAFLSLKLEGIETSEPIEDLLRGLEAAGLTQAVRVQTFKALRAAFEWGIGRRWIRWNPAKFVESKPAPPQKEREKLTVGEVRKLIDAASQIHPDLPTWVLVAALTGLRRQALLGLRWSDIDLDAQLLTVNRVINEVWGQVRVVPEAKARHGKPAPQKWIDPAAVTALAALRSAQLRRCAETGTTPPSDGWVFSFDGLGLEHMTPNHVQHLVARAGKAAGLPHRSHDLRHHRASELIEAGVSPVRVAEELDHGSADFTLRTYAGVTRPAGEGAMAGLGEKYMQDAPENASAPAPASNVVAFKPPTRRRARREQGEAQQERSRR